MKGRSTLHRQFLLQLLSFFLAIAVISGYVQFRITQQQISQSITNITEILVRGLEQGIVETQEAEERLEHQISLQLVTASKVIADALRGKNLWEITSAELEVQREKLGLAGITLFEQRPGEFVSVVSTDPDDVNFSTKAWGEQSDKSYQLFSQMLTGEVKPESKPGPGFLHDQTMVLPVSQSGSHQEPSYYKYAYASHGLPFIVNPYLEAGVIRSFTERIGPNAWIEQIATEEPLVLELGLIDPEVLLHPKLAQEVYPPRQDVVYGSAEFLDEADDALFRALMGEGERLERLVEEEGRQLYQVFIPASKGQFFYISLDYEMLKKPLLYHSGLAIITGLGSLTLIFLVSYFFFRRIYRGITHLEQQMMRLATGDFTARSHLVDAGELSKLSYITNQMVKELQVLLQKTMEHAASVYRLSLLLDHAAEESLDEMYSLSTEWTGEARAVAEEVQGLVQEVVQGLQISPAPSYPQLLAHWVDQLREMQRLVNKRAESTTDVTLTLSSLIRDLKYQSAELSKVAESLRECAQKFHFDTEFPA